MAEEQSPARIEAAPPTVGATQGRAEGVSILAVYHYFLGALFVLLTLLFSLPAVITVINAVVVGEAGILVATGILALLAFITLLLALVFLAVGWGLWKERDWARIGAIVLGGLGLLFVPIGTMIGGLTIWYLVQPRVVARFR